MSMRNTTVNHQQRTALLVLLALTVMSGLSISGSVAAQSLEPLYRFEFSPRNADGTNVAREGTLIVHALPRADEAGVDDADRGTPSAVPVILNLEAVLFPGLWLGGNDIEQPLNEQEAFVLAKFRLFQNAGRVEEFQQWLDPETYQVFVESVAAGEISLAEDREVYRQYDSIRLLASIRYGDYTLLYTQFRDGQTGDRIDSVMPARMPDGRLVTAGNLHASSHDLYRLLAFGSLQRQLILYLEGRVQNQEQDR